MLEFLKVQSLALYFFNYINYLSTRSSSHPRLSADDTSFFSAVRDMTLSANALNNDLLKINNESYRGNNESYRGNNESYRGNNEPYWGNNESYRGNNESYRGKMSFYSDPS